jgi:hypothetical protein
MTKADLVEQLKNFPDNAELYAFDGDEGEMVLVTGLLYYPDSNPPSIEFHTDDP